jgi:hypothetical protein
MHKFLLCVFALIIASNSLMAQDSAETDEAAQSQSVTIVEEQDLAWLPAYANSETARYYYLPDLQVYYDVVANVFVYYRNDWVAAPKLPQSRYGKFDLTKTTVVPLDWAEGTPMNFFEDHQKTYPVGYKYEYAELSGQE